MVDDVITSAYAYWEQLRRGRTMPARADIDPLDIPKLLPFIMLVDVLRDPLDFKFRLIGTEVNLIIAHNYRGRRFSEIPHMAQGNEVWTEYADVVGTHQPVTSEVNYVGPDRYVRSVEHCLMPLSADGATVNMIFAAVAIQRAMPQP